MGKSNRTSSSKFAKMENHLIELPAWKALGPAARVTYVSLLLRCYSSKKAIRNNNGDVAPSVAELAEEMSFNRKTVTAALAELQATGFIVCTRPYVRGAEGKGRPSKWRLTMNPTTNAKPTMEPRKWRSDRPFPVVVHQSALPKKFRTHP